MSGSIRLKREPDYWELRVYAGRDPITQKRRYVSRTFRGGKRAAKARLAELVSEVAREGVPTELTLSALLTAHIDHLAKRGREARTIEGYRTIARGVGRDKIGARPLAKITVKSLDDYYARLQDRGLSASTVRHYYALIAGAWRQAMAWGWVSKNIPTLSTPPSVKRVGREIPTGQVVAAILARAEASRNPENLLAFRLLATTGARRGEICGLRWSAVDLKAGHIEIRSSVAQLSSGDRIQKAPKTHQIRENALDRRTVELLRIHRVDQHEFAVAVGARFSDEGYVLADLVSDPTGRTPIPPNRLTQAFRRICQTVSGAENVRLHDLRHWFASSQLDAGEPLPAVAARIGDNVETLAKVYAHKGRRGDHDAVESLAAAIDGTSDGMATPVPPLPGADTRSDLG